MIEVGFSVPNHNAGIKLEDSRDLLNPQVEWATKAAQLDAFTQLLIAYIQVSKVPPKKEQLTEYAQAIKAALAS